VAHRRFAVLAPNAVGEDYRFETSARGVHFEHIDAILHECQMPSTTLANLGIPNGIHVAIGAISTHIHGKGFVLQTIVIQNRLVYNQSKTKK
jgi:hypothetical protein